MDHGHETEEEFMAGLAAEVIERVGGTKPLWNGLHTNAMVKMMFLGKIQTHAARGLIREVRTLLYEGKRAMWNIRNKNNFNDEIEAERFSKVVSRNRIEKHMRNNNKAQRSNMSVDAILAMDYPDREEWIKATTDQTQQQRRIDHMMPLVVSTKKTQILEPERIPTIEELVQQQLEAMRKPRQQTLHETKTDWTKPVERDYHKIGKLTTKEHETMRNKRDQQRAHEKKTYKHKCAMHAKDKTRARQKSKPKPAQQANARARGNKACEECNKSEGIMYECNLCKKIWHRRCGKQEGLPCKGAIANEWSCKQCTRATKTTTNSPTIGARTPQNKTKGQARTPPRPMGECVQHNNEMQKDANKQQTHGMHAHNKSTTSACSYSSTSSCDEQGASSSTRQNSVEKRAIRRQQGAEQMQFVQQVNEQLCAQRMSGENVRIGVANAIQWYRKNVLNACDNKAPAMETDKTPKDTLKFIKRKGYIIDVLDDGHCLFRSIGKALEMQPGEIMTEVGKHIRTVPEDARHYIPQSIRETLCSNYTRHKHTKHNKKGLTTIWGGTEDCVAIARWCGRDIVYLNALDNTYIQIPHTVDAATSKPMDQIRTYEALGERAKTAIYLFYTGYHFSLLLTKDIITCARQKIVADIVRNTTTESVMMNENQQRANSNSNIDLYDATTNQNGDSVSAITKTRADRQEHLNTNNATVNSSPHLSIAKKKRKQKQRTHKKKAKRQRTTISLDDSEESASDSEELEHKGGENLPNYGLQPSNKELPILNENRKRKRIDEGQQRYKGKKKKEEKEQEQEDMIEFIS